MVPREPRGLAINARAGRRGFDSLVQAACGIAHAEGRDGRPGVLPAQALDHATGEAVMDLLAGNAVHPDRAVIVVTHDTRVFHYADAIAHMDDGRIVKTESREPLETPELDSVTAFA